LDAYSQPDSSIARHHAYYEGEQPQCQGTAIAKAVMHSAL